jgi:hypothetical protein
MGAERRHVLVHDNGWSLVGHDDRVFGECLRGGGGRPKANGQEEDEISIEHV